MLQNSACRRVHAHAACSSSLVALNDAVSDLQSGRVDYALVGGASAILRPQTSLAFSKLNMLSPEVLTPPCSCKAQVCKLS